MWGMRILHVITGMARAAGTSVFCGEVLRQLAGMGHDCRLLVRRRGEDFYPVGERVRVFVGGIGGATAGGWRPEVVHIHALWDPWLMRAFLWAKLHKVPVVWSPHGMLTPWALSQRSVKKWLALVIYQWWGLRGAALLHVTAPSEVEDMRRLRLSNAITQIPLGGEIVDGRGHKPKQKVHTALFVSRVHPKKGLFNLVEAWGRVRPAGWRLVIAGPSDGQHAAEVIARARALGLGEDCVRYVGPVYGEAKRRLYKEADLFVLPTYSENFGVVVLEALASRCPVITTKGAPWEELESHRCGWWIDIGVEPLVEALREAVTLTDAERAGMGENGCALVCARYSWEAVGSALEAAYQAIRDGKK